MFDRILVPVDGSPQAEQAIDEAGRFLAGEPAEWTLLVVVDMKGEIAEGIVPVTCSAPQAKAYVHELAVRLRAQGVRVEAQVRFGEAAEEILHAASDGRIGLIAMSTHGRTGLSRMVRGSVAEAVLRSSPTPVLLTRVGKAGAARARPEAARILVPLDGGKEAESILPYAAQVARRSRRLLEVLTVAEHVPAAAFLPEGARRRLEAGAREYATGVCAQLRQEGLEAEACVRIGSPAGEILERTRSGEIALVAMCTHGSHGVTRALFGSVAETVLRAIDVPLLTARVGRPAAVKV